MKVCFLQYSVILEEELSPEETICIHVTFIEPEH